MSASWKSNKKLRVLVACEFSGAVRDAFIDNGHDAVSCDILPTESPGPHIQCDVIEILDEGWDLMIAHPPCTYLTNSGVRWLHEKEGRWDLMRDGAIFFRSLLDADIPMIAVENPIMHKYAKEVVGRKQDQVIQPWMFGHMESKATCLWLKGLPCLVPTDNVKEEMMKLPAPQRNKVHCTPPGPDQWKIRSRTYSGIARAMADQWGGTV